MATLGLVFPSLVIISILAGVITTFADVPAVRYAFNGIRVCVCVLIFNSVLKLWKNSVKDIAGILIFVCVFLLAFFKSVSPAVFVIASAAVGIAVKSVGRARK